MAVRTAHVDVRPQKIFDVLRDGQQYARWVIGTKRIRSVDPRWPKVGSSLHFTAGVGPLQVRDRTVVRGYRKNRMLELEAFAKRLGSARVRIEVKPERRGSRVIIDEHPLRGPIAWAHNPFGELLIILRNRRMLKHLRTIVEGDSRARS
jgi:hypothetical protein